MNPRQRRGVLLLALAAIGAVAVFISVFSYVDQVRAQLDERAPVLRLTADAVPYEALVGKVEVVQVPVAFVPEHPYVDPSEIGGLVPEQALPAGTYLQKGMLVEYPLLDAAQRAVSLLVDAEMGAALDIAPGDIVDIIATFERFEQEDVPAQAGYVITCVPVLDVAGTETQETVDDTGEVTTETVIPMTFLMGRAAALDLAYARSFSTGIRLALSGRGTECSDVAPAPRQSPPTARGGRS